MKSDKLEIRINSERSLYFVKEGASVVVSIATKGSRVRERNEVVLLSDEARRAYAWLGAHLESLNLRDEIDVTPLTAPAEVAARGQKTRASLKPIDEDPHGGF